MIEFGLNLFLSNQESWKAHLYLRLETYPKQVVPSVHFFCVLQGEFHEQLHVHAKHVKISTWSFL